LRENFFTIKKLILSILVIISAINVYGQTKDEEPSGKLGGTIFGNYFYDLSRDTGISNIPNTILKNAQDVQGTAIERAQIYYEYKLNSKFSSRFTLESDGKNFSSSSDSKSSKFSVFVKDAWVKWKYCENHLVVIGLQPTPPYSTIESVWGNLFLKKNIMDIRGILPTRDLGVSFQGQFDSTGVVKYNIFIGNGSPDKPETDKYKRLYGLLEIMPFKDAHIIGYVDYQTKQKTYNADKDAMLNNDILTAALFFGIKNKKYSTGIEGYINSAKNSYIKDNNPENLKGIGLSIYGTYNISEKVAPVLRYDYFDPNISSDGNARNLIIVACNYKPTDKFTISPNVEIETYEKLNNRDFKNSITARMSFNWTF
jgi:hypothetical protein